MTRPFLDLESVPSQGSPSPGPTILPLGPSRDILFQNAFDLGDGFRMRH
jgi:hypothetical protein